MHAAKSSDNLVPILVEGALEILREEAGTKLDRRCVLTLASLVAEERAWSPSPSRTQVTSCYLILEAARRAASDACNKLLLAGVAPARAH